MPVTYAQFLTLLATALREENGLDLAYLIRPVSTHGKDLVKEFRNPTVRRLSLVPPLETQRLCTAAVSVSI
jgi:COP9 signalosome complex subunit 12